MFGTGQNDMEGPDMNKYFTVRVTIHTHHPSAHIALIHLLSL